MTAAATPGRTGSAAANVAGIAALVLAGLAIAWLLSRSDEIPLKRSAMGHEGLVTWLQNQGVEARYATGLPVTVRDIGLRILPILDTDLYEPFLRPDNREDYLKTGTERDIDIFVVRAKLRLLPTLVVPPKWTRAVRHSGYAHPTLLLTPDDVDRSIRPLRLYRGSIVRPRDAVLTATVSGPGLDGNAEATLYAPQLFPAELGRGCSSLIAIGEGHLLIQCERNDRDPFYALSDPDLLNNHGLARGENARIVAAVIGSLAGDGPVIVDDTDFVFAQEDRPPREARSWSDLLRFFEYPFSILWIGLGLMTVVALWRAWIRFGPTRKVFDDRIGTGRETSIKAKARILRMTGNDQRLFETHVEARLRMIASLLLGPHHSGEDVIRDVVAVIKRRDTDLAVAFSNVAAAATTPGSDTPPQRLLSLLEDFELQAERVLNEFGRV